MLLLSRLYHDSALPVFLKSSTSGWRLFPQRPPVRDDGEESDLEFGGVRHSGGGSGAVPGLSGRSTLCVLQTGRADIQKQGTHVFHLLFLLTATAKLQRYICYVLRLHWHF